jgi:hypothetical protein
VTIIIVFTIVLVAIILANAPSQSLALVLIQHH